jgi:hypothetical protein
MGWAPHTYLSPVEQAFSLFRHRQDACATKKENVGWALPTMILGLRDHYGG